MEISLYDDPRRMGMPLMDGCELEDIQSLMPEKLLPNIIRLKEQILSNISTIQSPEPPTEKIIK
ncbi:hypothetical protein ACQCVE_06060 [Metabacillus sp. 113a]